MKKVKNNTKKEQNTAQVENQEVVATTNATEVINNETSDHEVVEIPIGKKIKKDKKKSKKAKVEELPEAKSKKKKDKVIKEVAEKQKASIQEEVIAHRDVKYIYPEDVVDTLARKKWRQEVRNKYRSLEREMNRFIQDQSSKEYKSAKKAFDAYAKEVLKPGMAI